MAYSGDHGAAFENLINWSNDMYRRKNIALITKRATPVVVTKLFKDGRIKEGYFEKKSTVDYDGIYKGRMIAFEAKATTNKTSFALKNISPHQIEYLEQAEKLGAICFFLIEFSIEHSVFLVPFEVIKEYIHDAKLGGRKSIPRSVFDNRTYLVKSTDRALVDYLHHVDKLEWSVI
ncbi:Holliday junction resolvase RecU [Bacillus cereus]|uniref:Holliday junction resolvase RecU n=3 Tax=Bacillus thuringiensis TaxID=1428 RepID=A0A9W4AFA9_BACTO|nr:MULTISPECIES: Holliday junction resolvase RecU [Bacillus cereus group]MEB4839425.1 Holliday junction resolvase RecU [Paenibacillus jamilae]EXY06196.1 recombinase RecU [Bacillus thuringiensis]KAB1367987.1 Holliday junction resolvase RecU [Bacillus thuringiensis]KIP23795.1 recombination U family protein [Bacillus thuringiensis serovar morrisoni]MCR6854008.1 Holliday junction resolvase RecU [Bacillus thuringiensis]